MNSEIELLNKVREEFLSKRAKQEIQIASWAEKLEKVDPMIFKDVDLPTPLSLKMLIPELYKEVPDADVYMEEYKTCVALMGRVDSIADSYNEKAKQLLLEYNEIAIR